jgi:hypothetical protein
METLDPATRAHVVQVVESFDMFTRRVTWMLRALVALIVAVAVVFTWQQWKLGEVANRADKLSVAIQQERAYTVRHLCEETNARHGDLVQALRAITPQRQRKANFDQAVEAFAQAIVPVRNCDQVVRAAFPQTKKPK